MILFQKIIKQDDLRRNYAAGNAVLYVFGDNVKRVGLGGQAGEMRYEPNAVGVATLYAPHLFFRDDPTAVEAQKRIIDKDMEPLFQHVKEGGTVIWPADGIGTGLARLDIESPQTFDYLLSKLDALIKVSKVHQDSKTTA